MICLFGGTFDPVHFGHLRPALDVQQALGIDCVHLLPCRIPPHREMPHLGGQQRLALLQLAIAGEPGLAIDERELQREGPSFMVDTLLSLRSECGERPLCLALGMDALTGLDLWHRWEEIPGLCHLVVMQRPGKDWPRNGVVAERLGPLRVADAGMLHARPAGAVLTVPVTQMAVSSTRIRELLAGGRSARYLLPTAVLERIKQENWYAN
jgi:nicotinate-nucleotide adenylyltransferase